MIIGWNTQTSQPNIELTWSPSFRLLRSTLHFHSHPDHDRLLLSLLLLYHQNLLQPRWRPMTHDRTHDRTHDHTTTEHRTSRYQFVCARSLSLMVQSVQYELASQSSSSQSVQSWLAEVVVVRSWSVEVVVVVVVRIHDAVERHVQQAASWSCTRFDEKLVEVASCWSMSIAFQWMDSNRRLWIIP